MSIRVPELGLRELGRNVYIYSDKDLSTILGGLVATPGITNSNLYSMVEIILKVSKEYILNNEAGMAIPRDDQSLRPRKYIIVTAGLLTLRDQPWLPRMSRVATSTQDIAFVNTVRERDRGCIITGQPAWNADFGLWHGFKAVHLFPPEFQENWNDYNLVELIGNPEDTIYSAHNGILLESQMADLFDSYLISINPDVSITCTFFKFAILTLWLGQL